MSEILDEQRSVDAEGELSFITRAMIPILQ